MSAKNSLKMIAIAAWTSIILIAYATLAHVGFVYAVYYKLALFLMRPEMKTYAHLEHIIAFAAVGALFHLRLSLRRPPTTRAHTLHSPARKL
jgi:hypothetical protein